VLAHRVLARTMVAAFCGPDTVATAEARFNEVAKGGIPDNIPETTVPYELLRDGDVVSIIDLAVLAGFAPSKGEARKLIANKGLKLNGETVTDDKLQLSVAGGGVLQKGKDKFMRFRL
jgi:tyrosyl-tRNA synthetase